MSGHEASKDMKDCRSCDFHRKFYDDVELCVVGHFSRTVESMTAADGSCGPSRLLWRARPSREVLR